MMLLFSHSVMSKLFVTPCTVAHQAPVSMGFLGQDYWSGLPFPPPAESSQPRDQICLPASPVLQVDSLPLSHWGIIILSNKVLSYMKFCFI